MGALIWTWIEHGFDDAIPAWRPAFFATFLGVALVLKTAITLSWGEWSLLRPGSFVRWDLSRRFGVKLAQLVSLSYRPLLILRIATGSCLIFGYETQLCGFVCAALLIAELVWRFRYNTIFAAICSFAVGVGPAVGPPWQARGTSSEAALEMALLMVTTTSIYVNGAWLKARSKDFSSGALLRNVLIGLSLLGPSMKRWEFITPPRWLRDPLLHMPNWGWRAVSLAVIATEVFLVVALWSGWIAVAFVLGATMHLAFAMISPLRLLPFQIITLSTYLAFWS